MIRMVVTAIAVVGLAACSTGISSGGAQPSASVTVNADFQSVHKAVIAQAERCLRGEAGGYTVHSLVNDAGRAAIVRVEAPFTGDDVARINIVQESANKTQVDILMWGRGIWNEGAVRAMRAAAIYQVPSCVTYMPTDPVPGQPSKR